MPSFCGLDPPMTARVKISHNVDISSTLGISSTLKSRTLSNLMCSKYIYRSKWVNRFWLEKALSCRVEGGQNDSQNQSKMPLCAHLGQQSKKCSWLVFEHDSYLPLKFSYSRRVSKRKFAVARCNISSEL